ncbi:aspartate--tRNA ligase, mitochondrial-like [Ruditapes philippinarum]|uniref:aspartate--tRNA ligase, mitochondrial-like n=1 Tax=Ruditapes philippinarum TaxID=129788 RepID=UPI00295AF1E8|nr:aspartate--tRNA ligase, mitochondrial-like [Ruditapes philippinarum]
MSFTLLRRILTKHKNNISFFKFGKCVRHCQISFLSDAVSFTDRTHTCGSLTGSNVGEKVKLCGWVQYNRGGKFIVIRDWSGITQVIVPTEKVEVQEIVQSLTFESVIEVTGKVLPRPEEEVNPAMATGDLEIDLEEIQVLNKASESLPIPVYDYHKVSEMMRMEYRYMDIRNKQMQRNLRLRSKMMMKIREFLANIHEFVDVETPTLFRRTPGGAKEFIVPSGQPGKFYSLPQSPQQFKQLLMVGGIDRYFQIARCYRDEGSKPDRQPEFTQLDIEMSFVKREGIIKLIEEMMVYSWPEGEPHIQTPFPHLTYDQAMRLYGSDKPDTRFDMKITDITSRCSDGGVELISNQLKTGNGSVVAIKIRDEKKLFSKKKLEDLKTMALKALNDTQTVVIPVRVIEDGSWQSPIAKHMKANVKDEISNDLDLQTGDLAILAAGQCYKPNEVLGKIRLLFADFLESNGVQVREKNVFNFLWVEDFPLFLPKEDGGEGLESAHHPFTDAHPEDRHMLYTQPEKVRGQHYDLVLNGNEVGGGSIRIHDPDVQKYVLEDVLKEDSSQLQHLLKAFTTGCPPHGGIALGLDRLFAIICGAASIRDVIAFPKTQDGKDPMSKAPATVSQAELDSYHIQIKPKSS